MSEYQCYEFQAVETPLTSEQQEYLRGFSTRARITASSFSNEYHWGSFKGDETDWMTRFFDGHLYYANWGTRLLMLRVPATRLHKPSLDHYCGESLSYWEHDSGMTLSFRVDSESGDYVGEDTFALASLISIRDELAHADYRSLYLGWLSGLWAEADERLEPPVPAGLANLTSAQMALVELLEIDSDLLAVAAQESSPPRSSGAREGSARQVVRVLSAEEKDAILVRLSIGDKQAGDELLAQTNRLALQGSASLGTRTAQELQARAEAFRAERKRLEAESKVAEQARRASAEAAKRVHYLAGLMGREDEIWLKIETLASERKAQPYQDATNLILDLLDIAAGDPDSAFRARFGGFVARHSQRPALLKRLQETGRLGL